MTTPESKVKKEVKKILERYKIYYFMPVKHLYGKAGIGDFICCVNGKFLSIETKAEGGELTELQDEDRIQVQKSKGIKIIIWAQDLHKLEILIYQLLQES